MQTGYCSLDRILIYQEKLNKYFSTLLLIFL